MQRTKGAEKLISMSEEELSATLSTASAQSKTQLFKAIHETLSQIYLKAKESDESNVDRLGRFIKRCQGQFTCEQESTLLLECASLYIVFGDPGQAIQYVDGAMLISQAGVSPDLKRRIHNIAATCHLRLYNFAESCSHLDRGLQIAMAEKDTIGKFAILANVVALYEAMGLSKEAKALSLRMLALADDHPLITKINFQNAISGAWMSRHNDADSFNVFHEQSLKRVYIAPDVPDVWRALFEANHGYYLIRKGDGNGARDYIERAITERIHNGLRIEPVLYCAEAECGLSSMERQTIIRCRRRLRKMLKNPSMAGAYREEILAALVRLYAEHGPSRDLRTGLEFLRRLTEHHVAVKHRHFFRHLRGNDHSSGSDINWVSPRYDVPKALKTALLEGAASIVSRAGSESPDDMKLVADKLSTPECADHDYDGRSMDYDVAENWAVAAEFAVEGSGRHCYQVGQLASLIAQALGWSSKRCLDLGLACRLHDVGKILVDLPVVSGLQRFTGDSAYYNREHAIAGHNLLSLSADPILQLAAKIALNHHEWWNGCGQPSGVKQQDILVEARICAVADAYCALVEAEAPAPRWTSKSAAEQIASMAGVQIDPDLIISLFEALRQRPYHEDAIGRTIAITVNNRLYAARSELAERLALVDV